MDIASLIQEDKKFHIFQEDCGHYLKITIPGQISPDTLSVHWDKTMLKDRFVIPKDKRIALAEQYERDGLLPELSHKEIKKIPNVTSDTHCICAPWNMNSPDPAIWRVFERPAYWNLVERLWRPLYFALSDSTAHYDYVEYEHPVLPKVVSSSFVEKWYDLNQREGRFLLKQQTIGDKTTIDTIEKPNEILIKIKNHSFEHLHTHRVQLFPVKPTAARSLSEDELLRLKKSILSRDSYLLLGLSNRERQQLGHRQDCPLAQSLQVHWIQWLHLGGIQQRSNALLTTPDIALKYRLTVQKPFDLYWHKHGYHLQQSGKPIFLDIPVPLNGYRDKTIKGEHLDPAERRYINRQERHQLNRHAREAGRDYTD